MEEQQRPVMLALGGTPGIWLALNGYYGMRLPDGSYPVTFHNPLTGFIESGYIRNNGGINEFYFNGAWQRLDMAIVIGALNYNINRTNIGMDTDGNNGWSIQWSPTGITEGASYFIRCEASDANALTGNSTRFLQYNCSDIYLPGDYNNDSQVDMVDLMYLIDYFISNGPEPVGGVTRADANCDKRLNITDVIYFVNYIFGLVGPPCN